MPHSWGQIPDFNLWVNIEKKKKKKNQSPVDPSICAVIAIHVGM